MKERRFWKENDASDTGEEVSSLMPPKLEEKA